MPARLFAYDKDTSELERTGQRNGISTKTISKLKLLLVTKEPMNVI